MLLTGQELHSFGRYFFSARLGITCGSAWRVGS